MSRLRVLVRVGALASVASLLFVHPALAYLDPVSGSMFVQGLIAGVVGAFGWLSVFARRLWVRLRGTRKQRASNES